MSSATLPMPARYSGHAVDRALNRGIRPHVVDLVMTHGRLVHARGAAIRVVGRREVDGAKKRGVDLRAAEGVHVVLDPHGERIITVYRNHDLRGLRPRRRTRRWKKAGTGFDRRSLAAMVRGTYRIATRPERTAAPEGVASAIKVRITEPDRARSHPATKPRDAA